MRIYEIHEGDNAKWNVKLAAFLFTPLYTLVSLLGEVLGYDVVIIINPRKPPE